MQPATALIQAAVVGAAIPNFMSIIVKRHPSRETSLVNYNIVLIFIPCCLFGSTIGSLMQNFVPQLFQNLFIMMIFSYFAFKFMKKWKAKKLKEK